jgi:hypothetical protein
MEYIGKGTFLSFNVDNYHCDKCNIDYWFYPRVQKCLRKDTKCPVCDKAKKPWWKFWNG